MVVCTYLLKYVEAEGWYIIIILLGSLIIHILLFIRKKGGFTSNFGTIMNHPFVYSVHSAVILFTWKLSFGSSALSILFAHEITISNHLSLVLFLVVSFCETAKFLFQEVGSEKNIQFNLYELHASNMKSRISLNFSDVQILITIC